MYISLDDLSMRIHLMLCKSNFQRHNSSQISPHVMSHHKDYLKELIKGLRNIIYKFGYCYKDLV